MNKLVIHFYTKIKYVQYNACLAIKGAIRGASKEKLYDELGLESFQLRRWYRKTGYFYKFYRNESPQYLFKLVSLGYSFCTTRNAENIPFFKTKHNVLKNSFFLSAVIEWNSLDHKIQNARSFSAIKISILQFIRAAPNSDFNCESHEESNS